MFSPPSHVLKMKLFVQILCDSEEFPSTGDSCFYWGYLSPGNPQLSFLVIHHLLISVVLCPEIWSFGPETDLIGLKSWLSGLTIFFKGGGDGIAIIISKVAHPI